MSGKRTLSLSAYKKSKALAVAPAKKERRLGFGESVSTREARAQELQLETRVIKHLDELLKKCGKDPGSAKAISNWLCAEGLEGHAKKGLSRILCYAKVWSRTLRAEGVAPKEKGADKAEAQARVAFAACVCAVSAVDSLSYRFAEARDGESELVKMAGEVLTGMMEAMVGAGAKPRARGLHPSEHVQLSGMVESWRKRGAIPSSSLQAIEKQLSALEPGKSNSVPSDGKNASESTSRGKNGKKRAAWAQAPAAAAAHSGGGGGSPGTTPSPSASSGRLSPPPRPSSGDHAVASPQTDVERSAGVEAALKGLLHGVALAGGWWAQAFEGSGPFPQGPEGCWSLQYQRTNEDPGHRQKRIGGPPGFNGDFRGEATGSSGGLGNFRTEAVDGFDSDGAPSTPSTVPSEASPSPERLSPVPSVKTEG
ncbi:unnamed protein product, partial [Hapterophycus canaliculatus]